MGLFKKITVTAHHFCTGFQRALLTIRQPLGFRLLLYELDPKKKSTTQEKPSAKISLMKIFAKITSVTGALLQVTSAPSLIQAGKSLSWLLGSVLMPRVSSHLEMVNRTSSPAWQGGTGCEE